MQREFKLDFLKTAIERSAIAVDAADLALDLGALDAETIAAIDDLMFAERMLGARAELLAGAEAATLH